MASGTPSGPSHRALRRQFLAAIAGGTAASVGGLVGSSTAREPGARGRGSPPEHAENGQSAEQCGSADDSDASVVDAVEQRAIPIALEDGDVDLPDLVPAATHLVDGHVLGAAARAEERAGDVVVAGALAESPIVGMGEATHGTNDFHALRRRIVQQLVSEDGLRVVAFEDQFSSLASVNDYVVHGEGDLEDATDQLTFWVWSSAEVRRLFEWLREFNRGRPRSERVEVHGVDCQYPTYPAQELRAVLERGDPEGLAEVEDALVPIAEADGSYFFDESVRTDRIEAARGVVGTLSDRLHERRESFVEATSEREWRLARRHLRALEQSADFFEAYGDEDASAFEVRDRYMAENATWLLDGLDADQVALWAHNDHVKRGTIHTGARTLGDFLDETHGGEYYPLALTFGRGSFTAHVRDAEGLQAPTIEAPVADTDALLTDVQYPQFFLDFDAAAEDPTLGDWLPGTHELHSVGALYVEEHRTIDYDLTSAFEGVAFVRETTDTTVIEPTGSDDEESGRGVLGGARGSALADSPP